MEENRIKELEEKLKIQMHNNKILNIRCKKLQEECIKYQKQIRELKSKKKISY